MDDPNQPGPTAHRRPSLAVRPFAHPERPADPRPTPLGTRSVLFVPPVAREEVAAPSTAGAPADDEPRMDAMITAPDEGVEPEPVAPHGDDVRYDDDPRVAADDRAPALEWTRTLEDLPAAPASDVPVSDSMVEPYSGRDGQAEVEQGEEAESGEPVIGASSVEVETVSDERDEPTASAGSSGAEEVIAPDTDWSAATDYPPDDLGFPSIPPGYEFALDEAAREGGDLPQAKHGSTQVASSDDPSSRDRAAGDRAAAMLEELADRLRRGEVSLPAQASLDRPANVLAGLLMAVLAGESSPGQDR